MVETMRRPAGRRLGRSTCCTLAICALASFVTVASASATASHESVIKVGHGIDMVDLDAHGRPMTGAIILLPRMSADGQHVVYGFDIGSGREYGLVWRNLKTGRTIRLTGPSHYPYALDLSASGRYVVYSAAAKVASNGHVTGTAVWLWDTKTNKRTIINRLANGGVGKDGSTDGVSVSANGRWIAFASSSRILAPAGAIEDPGNTETNGYIYVYDRVKERLTPLPWSSSFSQPTSFRYPVISADGAVVAFENGLDGPMVWYPGNGFVRSVPLADETGVTDSDGLALSADGGVLASSAFGVSVVALGESSETDRLAWSEHRHESLTGAVTLSGDGSKLAFLGGEPGQPKNSIWHIWLADVSGGPAWPLRLAPNIHSLPAAPRPFSGSIGNRVTMSADGGHVATSMCSRGYESRGGCVARTDFFRWRISR